MYANVQRISMMVLLLAAAASCGDLSAPSAPAEIVPAPAPLPQVNVVQVDTTDTGGILLEVTAPQIATVEITYWSDSAARLVVTTTARPDRASIALPRLQAAERYHFSAVALDAQGRRGPARTGEFETLPLPDDLAGVHFAVQGTPTLPLTMLELSGAFHGFVAIDATGHPVWWFRTQGAPQGFARRANGDFVLNDNTRALFEVTAQGDIVRTLPLPGSGRVNGYGHHDVLATPDDHILFLAQDTRVVGDAPLTGDAIWEWQPEADVVTRRFSTFDAFDPSLDKGRRSVRSDWFHANSLAYGDHGNVILSLNWTDQIVSIAPDFSAIEWKLGGRGSTFAIDSDAMFQGQHTAQILPNGHVLMFDNERDRGATLGYSRALELALDGGSAHHVWSYRASPDIYAPYQGSARRLANGNTFVHFAMPAGKNGATGPITAREVRMDGSLVWSVVISDLNGVGTVYRATPLASLAGEHAAQ